MRLRNSTSATGTRASTVRCVISRRSRGSTSSPARPARSRSRCARRTSPTGTRAPAHSSSSRSRTRSRSGRRRATCRWRAPSRSRRGGEPDGARSVALPSSRPRHRSVRHRTSCPLPRSRHALRQRGVPARGARYPAGRETRRDREPVVPPRLGLAAHLRRILPGPADGSLSLHTARHGRCDPLGRARPDVRLPRVGFGRVPGVGRATQSLGFTPPDPGSIAARLLRHGTDFVWRAADGSTVVAHWMPGGYCQGDFGLGGTFGQESLDRLARLIATDGNASRTPYIFIPIGCDFSRPRPDLLDLVAAWNAGAYARTGVWAVAATFDHYVQLLAAHRAALPFRRFDPTPYWTGFYATRP